MSFVSAVTHIVCINSLSTNTQIVLQILAIHVQGVFDVRSAHWADLKCFPVYSAVIIALSTHAQMPARQ